MGDEEAERLRLKAEAEKKKAKMERALRRNEALLRGEEPDPPTPPSEVEDDPDAASASMAINALHAATPPAPAEATLNAKKETGAVRTGSGRELPPLSHPP